MEGWMKTFALAIAAAGLFLSTTSSFAQRSIHVGTLVCNFGTTVGMLVGSRQRMTCVFHRNNGDIENYSGTFTRLGLDVGIVGAGRMAWTVFSRTTGVEPRALVGSYAGAAADASLSIGGGGNVLIGGSRRSIMLQPVSLQIQTGVNLAVGVGRLQLR
jgi:hypothetical protein